MRTTDRRLRVALAVPLALGGLATIAPSASARVGGKLVPRTGALLGAYVADNGARHQTRLGAFERKVGRKMAIDHRFYGWHTSFPLASDKATVRKHRILFITWRPDSVSLASIASGSQDAWIRKRARALKRLHKPVMLAFAHEMNGNWYRWGTQPKTFVRAWRRIVDVSRKAGGSNIVWVWSPNWKSVPETSANAIWRYYPGDRYVNWVAVSAYNRGPGSETRSWRQLRTMIAPVYRRYSARKPIMVRETGSVEYGGSKAHWILTAASDLKRRYPGVAAFLWFNAVANGNDWRVDTSRASLNAFRRIARYPWFRP